MTGIFTYCKHSLRLNCFHALVYSLQKAVLRCMQEQKVQLDKLAQQPPSNSPSSNTSSSAIPYLLMLSLFVWSPSQWAASHRSVLLHCLRFALSQKQPAGSTSSSSEDVQKWREASDDELWACVFPMIRYFGLVHHLQEQLKGNVDADWNAVAKRRYAFWVITEHCGGRRSPNVPACLCLGS